MGIKIRDARLQDTGFILSGIRDIFRMEKCIFNKKVYTEKKKLARSAIKDKRMRIAVKDTIPVGFLWFGISDITPFGLDYGKWSGKYCWISFVYVVEEYRSQGIGSLLYEDITRICRRKKIEEITLDVFTINKKSEKFHKKIGFRPMLSLYSKKLDG